MVGFECKGAESVLDAEGNDIASECDSSEIGLVENSLVLVDELIVAIDGSCGVDEIDGVVWEIVAVWKFNRIEDNLEGSV